MDKFTLLGERLRQLIEDNGVTPYVVSEKTGISQATIGRIINKTTIKPNSSNIEILAKYFNVNAKWLMTGVGDKALKDESSSINDLILSQQRTIEDLTSIIKVLTIK